MSNVFHRPNPQNETYQMQPVATKKGEDEEFDKFAKDLCGKIKAAKKKRKFLEDDWTQCEKNFYATGDPENSKESMLDFTITFEICQDASSNLSNAMLAQDQLFVAAARPGFKQYASSMDTMLDWMADRAQYLPLIKDAIRMAQIYTKSIVKSGWSYKEEQVGFWDWEIGEDGTRTAPMEKTQTKVVREGCFPHLVDPRRFIHPLPCGNLEEAEWVAEEFDTTRGKIQAEVEKGFYRSDLDVRNVGQGRIEEDGKGDETELAASYGKSEITEEIPKEEEEKDLRLTEAYATYQGREVIIWLDVPSDDWVAAYDNFFQSKKRPYETWSWYPILNSIDGKSLCSILDPEHRGYVAIMNILLNSGVRSIEPLIVALRELGLSEYQDESGSLGPGLAEVDKAMMDDINKGLKVINLTNGDVSYLIEMLGKIEQHMRDTAAIPRAFRGEELADRPTATGTSAIIEKAMQPLFDLMERFRDFMARVAKMQYARYRQFYPQELQILLGTMGEDGQRLTQLIQFPPGYWEDQILIETKVNSQTMSKSVKKQEALAMLDKWTEMWQNLVGIVELTLSGQPIAPFAGQALDAQKILMDEFFTEFEVPEVRDVLQFDSAKMVGEGIAQTIDQLTGIINQGTQEKEALIAQLIDLGAEPVVQSGAGQGGPGMAQGPA